MRARPLGVTILAILALVGGIFALCGGSFGLVGSGLASIGKILGYSSLRPGAIFWGSILSLAVGALYLVLGWGALSLRPWAWLLGVGLQVFALIEGVVNLVRGDGRVGAALGIILAAAILFYLFQARVQQAFGRQPTIAAPGMG
jgi:hypothetical protein